MNADDLKLAGKLILGTAAVGLGLCFGQYTVPGQVAFATDVAVDLGTGEGEGGQQPAQEQPSEQTRDVYLMENYNPDFDLYEESFNNRYFIYMNVRNGGITSGPVIIDIPANLTYTMEKDGQPVKYTSGTAVQAVGVYVMTLSLDETDGITTTHYNAVIRFRIMEAEAQVTPQQTGDGGLIFDGSTEIDVPELSQEELDEIGRKYDDLTPEEQAALEAAFSGSEWTEDELLNPDGTINQEALDALMAEKLGEMGEIEDIYMTDGVNEGTGMQSGYDAVSGYYKHTLISGQSFYSDVQNGQITRLSVSLIGADGVDYEIYKDGELYEAEDRTHFTEAGSYLVIPVSSDPVYLDAYQENKPVFSFRIMDNAANDLSLVHAPDGYMIGSIYLDELPCKSAYQVNAHTVMLREDGDYRIEMTDGEVTYEMSYTLDRVRPRFYVQVNKNTADIAYLSDDVRESLIYRNEELYNSDSVIYKIKDTGKYKLYVFDEAGNYSGRAFDVKYGMNKGAVVAVALVIAAVVGLFVYLRYLNTHVKVR